LLQEGFSKSTAFLQCCCQKVLSFYAKRQVLGFGGDLYHLRQTTVVSAKNSIPCPSILATCTASICDRSSDTHHHEKSPAGNLTSIYPHRRYHASDPCKGARRAHLCVDSAGGDGGSRGGCLFPTHTPSLASRVTDFADRGEDASDPKLWAHSN